MSIGRRVTEAFQNMVASDPAEALYDICSAIDRTAQREGRGSGRKAFKSFVEDNTPIITAVTMGIPLRGMAMKYDLPMSSRSGGGSSPHLKDILYHAIRCKLYHETDIPANIRFTENRIGPDEEGTLQIPSMLVAGLILAVVASPANVGERTEGSYYIRSGKRRFYLNAYWGRRDEVLDDLRRLYKEQQSSVEAVKG